MQQPQPIQKPVGYVDALANKVECDLGTLAVNSPFTCGDGKEGKVLEILPDGVVKVLVQVIGAEVGVELIWPVTMRVCVSPDVLGMETPEPASTTKIRLQDVPIGARCKIMSPTNEVVTVQVKGIASIDTLPYRITVGVIGGSDYDMRGDAEVLGVFGKEDTTRAVRNAHTASDIQDGTFSIGDKPSIFKAIGTVGGHGHRFQVRYRA